MCNGLGLLLGVKKKYNSLQKVEPNGTKPFSCLIKMQSVAGHKVGKWLELLPYSREIIYMFSLYVREFSLFPLSEVYSRNLKKVQS